MKIFSWLRFGPFFLVLHVLWIFSGVGPQTAFGAPVEGKGKYAGMVLIPAGPFTMGRNGGPPDEKPAHKVHLPAYYIDKNLVTWVQYAEFIRKKGPTGPKGEMYLDVEDQDNRILFDKDSWAVEKGFEKFPAGELAWHGAIAYCKWKGKRLPSEAEWEKAARGTDARLYPWGNQKPAKDLAFFGSYRNDVAPVGRYPKGASPYGVLDMAGQVWEWTRSLYRPYPYKPKDGRESFKVHDGRVARGGNTSSDNAGLTSTSRVPVYPERLDGGHRYFGFRCASKTELLL
ncbi:MAG: SUMF1/EgtB/PvdO family nonheme iron enzyme [Nitrospinaceae bacterium]|jgi:formylglycine-generating enzyme required for sulfatase activity|nr:SUMF1/EgtB/PvdO family nonheme iron enzyme [Nitrospinaceae bacterium]MBT3433256.1 SUMF1/EgtB/PvdO family nonheme iron enzyme [Nitrospinaceae bacterium]MBT3822161.1 SUMF1/EgtB/PvdO family nonheme iron enzyme [Nitrospinaceae bacterium]MBT4095121.1 SUMF1/EgtB/PvdO family nonheme iron enzyme [Nitrospinaceae bacterium]MBT4431299.1 SUMF1/EgtB/PvdO family nonheme iron enzyme [Nitrospinaceae bacterium]